MHSSFTSFPIKPPEYMFFKSRLLLLLHFSFVSQNGHCSVLQFETSFSALLFWWLFITLTQFLIYMQLKQCCSRRAAAHPFPSPMQLRGVSWPVLLVPIQQTCSPQLRQALKLAVGTTCTLKNLTTCKSVFMLFRWILYWIILDHIENSASSCFDFAADFLHAAWIHSICKIFWSSEKYLALLCLIFGKFQWASTPNVTVVL